MRKFEVSFMNFFSNFCTQGCPGSGYVSSFEISILGQNGKNLDFGSTNLKLFLIFKAF